MNGASIFYTYADALKFQKISSDSDIDCLKIGKLFPVFSKVI